MKYGIGELLVRKGLWSSRNKVGNIDGIGNTEMTDRLKNVEMLKKNETTVELDGSRKVVSQSLNPHNDDIVSGFLYDKLQKEVISLRKTCEKKDSFLHAKDEEIKQLTKKVDTLVKALEVESKKIKRETAAREKNLTSNMLDDNKNIRRPKRFRFLSSFIYRNTKLQ